MRFVVRTSTRQTAVCAHTHKHTARTKTKPRDLRLPRPYKWNLLHWIFIFFSLRKIPSLSLAVPFCVCVCVFSLWVNQKMAHQVKRSRDEPVGRRSLLFTLFCPLRAWITSETELTLKCAFVYMPFSKWKFESDATAFTSESVNGAGQTNAWCVRLALLCAQVHNAHFNYFRLSKRSDKNRLAHRSAQLCTIGNVWKSNAD